MCEIPNNVILAEEFGDLFDGFSIGSNDLTQLTLGVDRDSELLAHLFDERDPGVKRMIEMVVDAAHRQGEARRDLRPGTERLPGVRGVSRGHRHRFDVAQSRFAGGCRAAAEQGRREQPPDSPGRCRGVNRVREEPVWRWEGAGPLRQDRDDLVVEEPLEIRVRGRSLAVTMRTPGHDEELAAGFLLSEGMITGAADVLAVEPCPAAEEGNRLDVRLAPDVAVDLERLSRHVLVSSSCGLCGRSSIDMVHRSHPPIESVLLFDPDVLRQLPERMRAAQTAFARTGGLHAAGLFEVDGGVLVVREDVGRHNAVDKVLGFGVLRDRLPFDRHVLMVSGRASFEIVQKALAARIPLVAAVSAPSSLAVELAARADRRSSASYAGTG